ncbi:SNF2 family N-terminal domain-domain-containing protein [Lobosporangium transversale]|uniref:SNF2 family N-terminal domain-domain-containing protein n=1 Tax=Lobosporangium transversale TaxID=64571 RepID=A0A1Y2GMQ6_9FUNG|nr:SNF2 family N-terminal domain-domain-containing protein [Lobosporangium transversale]ORZ14387.1 SNF2 family N-terminal domain-domain-containing protein [Lobosporangium transversale]|eukprot:XP_021880865.1 SNF2 family N-terminal domain-domain-containing protein [Lobosporangium transversale]
MQQQQQFQQLQQAQQQQLHQLQQQQQVGASVLPPTQGSPFSQDQLVDLRHQIIAFKLISANMAVPPNLQEAIFTPKSVEQVLSAKEPTASVAGRVVDVARHHLSEQTPTASDYNAYTSPFSYLQKTLPSAVHASRQQRLLIPSISPVGIDPYALAQERDNRLKNRVKYRIEELDGLPSNIASEALDPSGGLLGQENKAPPSGPKLRALIELKALRLLERQKKLRAEIIKGMSKATMLATSTDRAAYRRMKKQSLREARMTEKLERQQRQDREGREKQKHLDYLQNIVNHGRDMIQWHRTQQMKQNKLGRLVLQFHAHVEKEEAKRIERISKERLKALKNDDEEAYMKLIDQAKDTRITHLLQQTDSYLASLAEAVTAQQNDSIHTDATTRGGVELMDDESNFDYGESRRNDYYNIAHKIQERIVKQPSILTGGTLKEYQMKGLQWMASLYNNRLNGILADEMGLGKTIQTISLVTFLIEAKQQNGPFLILVPLSTLTNWTLEFEKWAPQVTKVVYKGVPSQRKHIQQTEIRHRNFQVLLTTYEYVIKDRPILSKIKWVYLIIDEGHRLKNANSKLFVTLTQHYSSRYRLILTGTPLQNNLPELWALLNMVLPRVFNSAQSFDEWFNTPFANTGGQDKIELNEEEALLIIKRLHKVLRPFLLRRLKKDVEAELPDKVERVIRCKMSSLQLKLYNQMKKHGMLFTQAGEKGRTGIKGLNNTIMQLRKICNHPYVFEEVERVINPAKVNNDQLYRVAGKFELLDRMLPKLYKTGHRVLIFFQMTAIMNIMEDFLHFRNYQYMRLDGSTKSDDRSALLKQFNAPDSPYFVFLLSTRAGGLGLNLQTADTVIIFDSDWNPHQDLQAQDRAHRIGQTKEVRIFRLVTEKSVEEHILARAQYKLEIDGKVIQAGKFDNKSTAEEQERFLRSLLESDNNKEENDVEEEEMNDEELNEIVARTDEEMTIFRKLDAERKRIEDEAFERDGIRLERLIQESELPEIYLHDEDPHQSVQVEEDLGRGQRVRAETRYDDGLTEEQWLEALEDEDKDVNEVIAQKLERRRKREEKRLQKENALAAGEDLDAEPKKGRGRGKKTLRDEDEEEVEPATSKKGRGRGTKSSTSNEITKPTAKGKRGRKPDGASASQDTLGENERKALTKIMEQCYKALEECTVVEEEGLRRRCELFLHLPSKKEYPEYYQIITRPIAMDIIKKRMRSTHYKSPAQFKEDVHLMFQNARTFNQEGSWVYVDSERLEVTKWLCYFFFFFFFFFF